MHFGESLLSMMDHVAPAATRTVCKTQLVLPSPYYLLVVPVDVDDILESVRTDFVSAPARILSGHEFQA